MELQELQTKLGKRADLEAERDAWLQKCTELEQRSYREKLNMEYEQSDVEALEGKTLKAFLYTALGKKEERLEQEEQEADEAKLQYEATLGEFADAQKQVKRIEAELRALKKAEQDYQSLVKEQAEHLKAIEPLLSDADALSLSSLRKELEEERCKQEHLEHALEEGNKLAKYAENVMESLRNAREEAKHDRYMARDEELNEAQERFKLVQIQFQRFYEAMPGAAMRLSVDFQFKVKGVSFDEQQSVLENAYQAGQYPMNDVNVGYPWLKTEAFASKLHVVLGDLDEALELTKRKQSQLEIRLSELLQKYQAM
ncbi:MAG: hypothetical protein IJW55_03205 [Clostridia bacterium]|nr:hypothetical protein [Clostridia bacterium]